MSLRNSLVGLVLAVASVLGAAMVHSWAWNLSDRLGEIERMLQELKGQPRAVRDDHPEVAEAHQREAMILEEHQREVKILEDWLGKVAVPRESILLTARQDAFVRSGRPLDDCIAEATMTEAGWSVSCGFAASDDVKFLYHYLIDPIGGKILSRWGPGDKPAPVKAP